MKRILICVFLSMQLVAGGRTQRMLNRLAKLTDYNGNTPLHLAAQQGDDSLVEFLCNNAGVVKRQENKAGQTPLHVATTHGKLRVVRHLVEQQGMDPDEPDRWGYNLLHRAADSGQEHVVRYLTYSRKMNIHTKTPLGETACQLASIRGFRPVVNRIIQAAGRAARKYDGPRKSIEKKSNHRSRGYCPICLEHVPKRLYNVTHYSCMHFICGPCKWRLKDSRLRSARKCPVCRGPIA